MDPGTNEDRSRPAQGPARVLGLFDATSVVVGAIVGVGIFFTPSKVAALTGSSGLALAAWGLAGFIAMCGALTFAELGGRYHASGAQYEILRDAYGPFPAFLFVFCNATAIQGGSIGIIALVCAFNLLEAVGHGSAAGLADGSVLRLAVGLILAVTVANLLGIRWGSRIQNLTVAAKLAALLAVVGLALWAPLPSPAPPAAPPAPSLGPAGGLLAALVPCLFAYGGWQQALWVSGEVKEPRRNLPRAILGGVVVVVIVYLSANGAFLALLGVSGVAGSKALAADAVAVVLPNLGRRLVAVAVAASAFGVLNAQLLTGPRLVYGMARDGRFFAPFAKLSVRFGTPAAAIALLGLTALALLLAAGPGGVDRLLNGLVFIDGVFFALTGAALLVLRRRPGADPEAFRTPGYPLVPLLFVLGELGVVAGAYFDPSVRSAAFLGLAWIAAAALLYRLRFHREPEPVA